jgi:hypothetical protein
MLYFGVEIYDPCRIMSTHEGVGTDKQSAGRENVRFPSGQVRASGPEMKAVTTRESRVDVDEFEETSEPGGNMRIALSTIPFPSTSSSSTFDSSFGSPSVVGGLEKYTGPSSIAIHLASCRRGASSPRGSLNLPSSSVFGIADLRETRRREVRVSSMPSKVSWKLGPDASTVVRAIENDLPRIYVAPATAEALCAMQEGQSKGRIRYLIEF